MRGFFRAFLRSRAGIAALVSTAVLVIISVIGPEVWGARALETDLANAGTGPSSAHLLGTDRLGRDILARTLAASRLTLGLALAASSVATLIGLPIGAGITLLGPRFRSAGLRLIDILLAFPAILLALIVAAILDPGPRGAVLAVGISFAPSFARLANTLAMSVAGREYVASARVIGISQWRLLWRYILPNICEPLILSVFNAVGTSLVAVSSLSFLGLGVQPPAFDWGRMLTEGVQSIYVTPVAALAPALAIALAGLTVGLLGDAIARAMNPLLWTQEAGAVHAGSVKTPQNQPYCATGQQAPRAARNSVLQVKGLSVQIPSARGLIQAVDGVTFDVGDGEIVGIVGESGSGKSMTALAIAQLVPYPGRITAERLNLRGEDILGRPQAEVDRLLGNGLALIFQDPMSSLNPALRVGLQLTEAVRVHSRMRNSEALALAEARMRDVHMPAPELRLRQFPHEFSGGMRQRAMIAMSLMNQPALIIADEPTTALDVTIQAQIMDVLREVNREHGTAILLISHDIGVIAEMCDRVMVMYAGRIVEDTTTGKLLSQPAHPYTRALMRAVPDITTDRTIKLEAIPGRPPDLAAVPPGCPFADRCSEAVARCRTETPPLKEISTDQKAACWVAAELVQRQVFAHE